MVFLVLLLVGVADVARIFAEQMDAVHAASVAARWKTLTSQQQYCSSPGGVATVVARDLGSPLATQVTGITIVTPVASGAPAVTVKVAYHHEFLFGIVQGVSSDFVGSATMPGIPSEMQVDPNCPAPVTPGPLPTSTNTPIPTNTPPPTDTPTITPTNTPTGVSTVTPTITPTVAQTQTPSTTPTITSTATNTGASTGTPTNTPTSTRTLTPTITPTNTPTPQCPLTAVTSASLRNGGSGTHPILVVVTVKDNAGTPIPGLSVQASIGSSSFTLTDRGAGAYSACSGNTYGSNQSVTVSVSGTSCGITYSPPNPIMSSNGGNFNCP
jgi:hypothetical protein